MLHLPSTLHLEVTLHNEAAQVVGAALDTPLLVLRPSVG